MKNIAIALISLLLAALSLLIPIEQDAKSGAFDRESVFRLHIIANSDTAFDQSVKLRVRDALLDFERESMSGCGDKSSARTALMRNGSDILRVIESTLKSSGVSYGAQLRLGRYDFPERVYSGDVYPAGEYDALRIVLGDGAGKNWWCVMFPPLCILELPDGKIDYERLSMDSLLIKLIKSIDGGKLWETITGKPSLSQ